MVLRCFYLFCLFKLLLYHLIFLSSTESQNDTNLHGGKTMESGMTLCQAIPMDFILNCLDCLMPLNQLLTIICNIFLGIYLRMEEFQKEIFSLLMILYHQVIHLLHLYHGNALVVVSLFIFFFKTCNIFFPGFLKGIRIL